mmetsp:Transcript_6355/g.20905  ORF Transcript_6355/g.20905 Transcript_6355/m.20905 type:complete len:260 (+) Transcript_6355:349-1128(+)
MTMASSFSLRASCRHGRIPLGPVRRRPNRVGPRAPFFLERGGGRADCSARADQLQHVLDARVLGEVIPRRVRLTLGARPLGHLVHPDHPVDQVGGGALAAHGVPTERLVRPGALLAGTRRLVRRAGQHNVHGLRELRVGVGQELNQVRAGQALILLPGRHDRAVVDADDPDTVDPCLLKAAVNLGSLEARDLARGSGGREGARQRDKQVLALADKGGHRLWRVGRVAREALMNDSVEAGKRLAHFDRHSNASANRDLLF